MSRLGEGAREVPAGNVREARGDTGVQTGEAMRQTLPA